MHHATLVLDQSYRPVKLIDWQRALCMSFLGKVEIIDSHDVVIRTVSASFGIPAVVRLLRHVHSRPLPARFSRRNVFVRDDYTCQYCGSRRDLTMDHVVPRSRGGRTNWTNVVTACAPCNRRKGNKTVEEAGMALCRPAKRPQWIPRKALNLADQRVPEVWRPWIH
jgi:5-methylcytosine-specific restriction endonuclease McrA